MLVCVDCSVSVCWHKHWPSPQEGHHESFHYAGAWPSVSTGHWTLAQCSPVFWSRNAGRMKSWCMSGFCRFCNCRVKSDWLVCSCDILLWLVCICDISFGLSAVVTFPFVIVWWNLIGLFAVLWHFCGMTKTKCTTAGRKHDSPLVCVWYIQASSCFGFCFLILQTSQSLSFETSFCCCCCC